MPASCEQIARDTNRTAAEVVLAWNLQQGVVVNPRTKQEKHMRDNLAAAHNPPRLTEEQMRAISNLRQDDCR